MRIWHWFTSSGALLVLPLASCYHRDTVDPQKPSSRPNFIFILTDDQDVRLESMSHMPLVQKHLVDKGVSYLHHFCTVALCCPSRVNLWTGKAAHNTNVTDLNPPYGGYPKFVSQGLNEAYLPVWLQEAGYRTYYVGKLFNAHTIDNYDKPYAAGFTGSDFLLEPYAYSYLNSSFQRNKDRPRSYEGQYSTDVVASKALGFLEEALQFSDPFFLAIAPVAPHTNIEFPDYDFTKSFPGFLQLLNAKVTPPVPATRHQALFQDAVVPRSPNFNPSEASGVSWIRNLPLQNSSNIDWNDELHRARLRSLQAIDELVDDVMLYLSDQPQLLENTYVIYTSDNGYHIGQHRLQPGKECGFEEDINVPLVIRGPAVPHGVVSEIVSSHTDLTPTILHLAGIELHQDFDGVPIPTTQRDLCHAEAERQEHANIEFWGVAVTEGNYGAKIHFNNTYKALRLIGKGYNLYYAVWCSNEHELYNMEDDPFQLNNLYGSSSTLLGKPIGKVVSRIDALLLVLKSCKGTACVRPWDVLHPDGQVMSLYDALKPHFDEFYETQQHGVAFSRCENGYIIDAEGPQEPLVYNGAFRWSEFV